MGPTYYMRLKHMVKDKINYRARGPNTNLTRQPVQGRANDGGLRIGEMERDGVLAHGMSYFLNESFMIRGDEYHNMAVCNKTGAISIYNNSKNLFFSLFADGPIKFHTNPDGSQNVKNVSNFGRSFSILRVPYALKLLIQELEILNIQMRVITDENVDQLLNMSYSNNITKLLKIEAPKENVDTNIITKEQYNQLFEKYEKFKSESGPALEPAEFKIIMKNKYEKIPNLALLNRSNEKQPIETIIDKYIQDVKILLMKQNQVIKLPNESPVIPSAENSLEIPPVPPNSYESPDYAPLSPANSQGLLDSPDYAPNSPGYNPVLNQEGEPLRIQIPQNYKVSSSLSDSSQQETSLPVDKETILEVNEPKSEENVEGENNEGSTSTSSSGGSKKIILSDTVNESSVSNSETKKINL
jgi:hypothetical protein